MRYFQNCKTIEDAKRLYRDLLMEHHPDHGGDEETAKIIINEFQSFLNSFMSSRFDKFEEEKGFRPAQTPFMDILNKIINFNMTVEIIGIWIFALDGSYNYRDQLKEMGFWFSGKHKCWIYSGTAKRKIRSKNTLDDNREMHGSEVVREKENQAELSA